MLDKLWGLGCHKFQQYNSLDGFASWGKVLWCGFSPWVFQLAMVPVPPSHLFGQTSNVAGHIIVKLIHPSTSWMERTKTRFDHFQLLFVVLKRGRQHIPLPLVSSQSLSSPVSASCITLHCSTHRFEIRIRLTDWTAFELDWYRTRRTDGQIVELDKSSGFSWMDRINYIWPKPQWA